MAEVSEENKQVEEVKTDTVEQVSDEQVLYPDKDVKVEQVAKEEVVEQKEEVKKEETQSEKKEEAIELALTIPEGSSLKEADIESVKSFAKENKLTQEAAQKLLDEKASLLTDAIKHQEDAFKAQSLSWLSEIEASPSFAKDQKRAEAALDMFFDKDFKQMLNKTGLGNHPALFKGLAAIGEKTESGKFEAKPKNAVAVEKPTEDYFYA